MDDLLHIARNARNIESDAFGDLSDAFRAQEREVERLRAVMRDCIGRPASVVGPMLKDALDQKEQDT